MEVKIIKPENGHYVKTSYRAKNIEYDKKSKSYVIVLEDGITILTEENIAFTKPMTIILKGKSSGKEALLEFIENMEFYLFDVATNREVIKKKIEELIPDDQKKFLLSEFLLIKAKLDVFEELLKWTI